MLETGKYPPPQPCFWGTPNPFGTHTLAAAHSKGGPLALIL